MIILFFLGVFSILTIWSMCVVAKKSDETEERFIKENGEEIHIKDNKNIEED